MPILLLQLIIKHQKSWTAFTCEFLGGPEEVNELVRIVPGGALEAAEGQRRHDHLVGVLDEEQRVWK